jgi:uncharacterized protein YndB with AHSA1/START domain
LTDGTFVTTVRIDAAPAEVFPYLVDPALITRWMGDHAQLDATPGGAYVLDINGVSIRGTFVEIDPPDTGWAHFLARLTIAAAGGDPGPDPWANP